MPTKYSDRLNLPIDGVKDITFTTKNGLKIANGYNQVIFQKKPMIEFSEEMLKSENIQIPLNKQWKIKNKSVSYIEYRSKDYCKVKILKCKKMENIIFLHLT